MLVPTFVEVNKATYLNDAKRYIFGDILVPSEANHPVVVPAAAAAGVPGINQGVVIEGGEDAVTEIYSTMGFFDPADPADVQARLRVEITDVAWRRRLMNRSILASHVFGTAQRPFRLGESTILEGQQTLVLDFSNPSTVAAANFFLAFETQKYQAAALTKNAVTKDIAEARIRKEFLYPFWFTAEGLNPTITVPASGNAIAFFASSRDVYLILQTIIASVIVPGGAVGDLQEVFTFQIFDAKDERPLQNQPVTMNTGTGTSQFPYKLPTALMTEPNTRYLVRFGNLVDQPIEIDMTFTGVANYVAQSPQRTSDISVAERQPLSVGSA